MLYAGLDLSRKRLDFHLLDEAAGRSRPDAAPLDADGLRGLAERVGCQGQTVRTGAVAVGDHSAPGDKADLGLVDLTVSRVALPCFASV